jgi:hypothetical protein
VLMGIASGTALGANVVTDSKPPVKQKSQSFLADLLTDDSGWALHRLQLAAWTMILGVLFVYDIWRDLAMPQFGDTLLGLMGVSSGSYVGLKIPEKQS